MQNILSLKCPLLSNKPHCAPITPCTNALNIYVTIISLFQCNPGVGLKAFFDMVHLSPKKLILFGAACSPVTDQIAKAARHWNLVQLTYADTHPMFTEKSFPHFYRVVPSENEFNPPRLSILRYFNWTRVGTLYQNSAKYALVRISLS